MLGDSVCIQPVKVLVAQGSASVGGCHVSRPPGHQWEASGLGSQRSLQPTPSHHPGGGGGELPREAPGSLRWDPQNACLPAAPGLRRTAGGGGDRVPGVEGLASPSAPPQPRGERLHRRRLQGAAPASRQSPAQVPDP